MKKRLISMTTAILPSEMLSLMTITLALQPIIQDGRLIGAVTHVLVNSSVQ